MASGIHKTYAASFRQRPIHLVLATQTGVAAGSLTRNHDSQDDIRHQQLREPFPRRLSVHQAGYG
jgi:hypothetical protein